MKAAQISDYGNLDIITINEVDQPSPDQAQVLVEVHSSSINPFDSLVLAGYVKDVMPLQLPATLGGDIAGIVTAIGDDVSGYSIGDKVYGQANAVAGNSGAFAEYAVTKFGQIAKMPNNLNFIQAGSLPLVGVSALQALTTHINLKSGQKIFIHGGSGGIGTIAIQIAKNIGAYVATTAAGDGLDLAKQLGADKIIDYKTQEYSELISDYDAVFDTVGGSDFIKSFSILKKGGIAVTMAGQVDQSLADKSGITAIAQNTHTNTEMLGKLTSLVESGVVTAQVGKVFPLDQIREAFTAKQSGSIKGKIVIQIR